MCRIVIIPCICSPLPPSDLSPSYRPANETPPRLSALDRCRAHMPSWKLFEYYTKVNFTLGFPPPCFARCCFHPTRCIVGPICLITDDEGAISRLTARGGTGKLERSVRLIPAGLFCNYCRECFLTVRAHVLIPVSPSLRRLKLHGHTEQTWD